MYHTATADLRAATTYCLFDTPLGLCAIAWLHAGAPRATPAVTALRIPEATPEETTAKLLRHLGAAVPGTPPRPIAAVIEKIRRHLQGTPQDFRNIPLDLGDIAPFARQVYEATCAIPAGRTRSYGEVAAAVGQPRAARAVGRVMAGNPVALIIPCHRVLAAGRKIGGYSAHGGLATKERMLQLEGVLLRPPPTIASHRDLEHAAARLRTRDKKLQRCMNVPLKLRPRPNQPIYASLMEAIVRQQLSPAAASTILARVKALFPGDALPEPDMLLHTPDQVLRAAGLSTAKTAALKDVAAKALDGTIPSRREAATLTDEALIRRLTAIRGVGRWTVEMLLVFHLRRADVLAVDDYALRKAVADVYRLKQMPTPQQFAAIGEAWRPYRTVASLYLWNHCNQM